MMQTLDAPVPIARPRSGPHYQLIPVAPLRLVQPYALIINDSRFFAERVARALQAKGFETRIATDGYEALSYLQERRHQLIVLDIDMPTISGLKVLRRLRLDPIHASVPVVMLGAASPADREQAIALGASGFLPKPLQVGPLYAMIDSIMG
ncbi:MAG: response regulator [Deltaproteobacteria bacterium]|nr:response regulator [Deltaproteobacteria bacterium]